MIDILPAAPFGTTDQMSPSRAAVPPEGNEGAATPIPSSAWVADQAERPRTYARTFAATSKAVHFSSSELLRRAWGEPGNPIDLNNPGYLTWRAALALTELLNLLPEIIDAVVRLCPEIEEGGESVEIADEGIAEYDEAWARFRARGLVPLIHPTMFNLHKIDWPTVQRRLGELRE